MLLYPICKNTDRGIECEKFYKNGYHETITIHELIYENIGELKIIAQFILAKCSIIEYLLKSKELHQRENKKDIINSFEIKKEHIQINFDKKNKTILCSYENKFLQDFNGFENALELETYDKYKCKTCAQDAKKQYKEYLFPNCKNDFSRMLCLNNLFPAPKDEFYALNKAKECVKQFIYHRSAGMYYNLFSYDIKSSFPARLYRGLFPCHKATKFGENENPEKKWYIKEIRIYQIEAIKYDFYNLCDRIADNHFEPFNLWVTKDIEESINKVYKVKYRSLGGYYYQLRKSLSDDFIYDNIYCEENKKKHIRKYNKAKNNLLIGTFGAHTEYLEYLYNYNEEKQEIGFTTRLEEMPQNPYYPLFLYVNGMAKAEFIDICFNNWESIVYANTDGIFSSNAIDFDAYNATKSDKIGCIELRAFYLKIAIKNISNYCAEYADENGAIQIDYRNSGKICDIKSLDEFCGEFSSIIYILSQYGFIMPYEYKEMALDDYVKYDQSLKRIETLIKCRALTITNREEVVNFREMEFNRRNKELLENILDVFDCPDQVKQIEKAQNFVKKYNLKLETDPEIINKL